MATYSALLLSGSSNGLPIPVTSTASTGTLLHTAISGTSGMDEVYLYAANVTATVATLTIEWGGTVSPTNHLCKDLSIPPNSPAFQIAAGLRLNNGVAVRAYSGTASAINVTGNVNRIT